MSHFKIVTVYNLSPFNLRNAYVAECFRGDERRTICHFDQFPPDIATILQSSGARQFTLSLGAGRWQSHWGPPSHTPQALHRRGNHESTEAHSSTHGPSPDGTRIEAKFGTDGIPFKHTSESWMQLRRALGGLLSVEMVPEIPSTAAHYWPPKRVPSKKAPAEPGVITMRADFPREKPGLGNLWPWLRLMPCSTGQPNIPSRFDSMNHASDKTREFFGLASLLNSEVFLGGEYYSLFLKATQSGCFGYENSQIGSERCTLALSTTLTTLLRDVVAPMTPAHVPGSSDSDLKSLGFSLASLLDSSGYNEGMRPLRNGPDSDMYGPGDSDGAAAAKAVDAQLSNLKACPVASKSHIRTIIPKSLTERSAKRHLDADTCNAYESKEECTSGSRRRISFGTPPVQEYSRSIEHQNEGTTRKGATRVVDLRETVHNVTSIRKMYGSSEKTLLVAGEGPSRRIQRPVPASAAVPWAVIETPSEDIPTAETSETWFDRQSISLTKRLLWNDAWRETVAIDSVVDWAHVSASGECVYAHFTEPIVTELTPPLFHTFRLNMEASPVVQIFDDVTSEEWTHLLLSLRDLPHRIMTEGDWRPTNANPAPQYVNTILQILLPLTQSCLQPDLVAAYPALSASLESLHRILNASHDIHIFSSYDFTPTVLQCLIRMISIFLQHPYACFVFQVTSMEYWPPDQARGFELPGASAALIHNVSGIDFLPVFEASVEPWAHSPGLLYLPPLLDFSMPFNLMTLNR